MLHIHLTKKLSILFWERSQFFVFLKLADLGPGKDHELTECQSWKHPSSHLAYTPQFLKMETEPEEVV